MRVRWVVGGVVALVAISIVMAWWLHRHESWGTPVSSAAEASAAVFAAVAAAASATAAARSSEAAQTARRALALHDPPSTSLVTYRPPDGDGNIHVTFSANDGAAPWEIEWRSAGRAGRFGVLCWA